MCAIAGIYAYTPNAPEPSNRELTRMRDHMAARGPDGKGSWRSPDNRVALAHRRLAIIDLSERAAQPMLSADGRLAITYNGEIYNYKALRQQLEAQGYRFHTQSDTEVLLHLYAYKGAAMVNHLRGMYAFAIWDEKAKGLLLARDPYGIKPLYYADDGHTLRFASQVKALLAGGGVSREPEPAGIAGFYLFGSVPEPWTTYRNIHALPAGSTLWISQQGVQTPKPYFSLAKAWRQAEEQFTSLDSSSAQETVREALLDSVRHHLVADVPVGAFLSAGIDSGALVGLMKEAGQQQIQTVTLAFGEFQGSVNDEAPLAAEIAKYYGVQHTIRRVTEGEFQQDLPLILQAMDQPTIDGINTWFVSKAARELGLKVAVSGLGGDELFGGYPSFCDIPQWVNKISAVNRLPGAKSLFSTLLGALYKSPLATRPPLNTHPKLRGLFRYGDTYPGAYLLRRSLYLPEELGKLQNADQLKKGLKRLQVDKWLTDKLTPEPHNPFGKIAVMEASIYMRNQLLRDTDWASMAHSLEVRVPLVDSVLLKRLAGIQLSGAANASKALLAKSPNPTLPNEILHRPKTGFSTPIAAWLQRSEIWQAQLAGRAISQRGGAWARIWANWVAQGAAK